MRGPSEIVKLMLDHSDDPGALAQTAAKVRHSLHAAGVREVKQDASHGLNWMAVQELPSLCEFGRLEVLRLLLAHGIEMDLADERVCRPW